MTPVVGRNIGLQLREYELPPGVLPLAPTRFPFTHLSANALAEAARLIAGMPEKRGILSRAVRAMLKDNTTYSHQEMLTIEAHFDGKNVPHDTCERLLTMGFEPDGFARFNPVDFDTHYTLKFKVARSNMKRCRELLSFVRRACATAYSMLCASGIEAYIELELYPDENRRAWVVRTPAAAWHSKFPLRAGALETVLPPRTGPDASNPSMRKRADIHVKVGQSSELMSFLCRSGFYPVLTWAGNNICTAQFSRAIDAVRVFDALERFFSQYLLATEMTLEFSPAMWRTKLSTDRENTAFAAVPPIVVAVDEEIPHVAKWRRGQGPLEAMG